MVPTAHRGEAKAGEFGPELDEGDGAAPCHQCRDDFRGAFLGGLFLPWTTGGAQVVELQIGALLFGGHPRIADQAT